MDKLIEQALKENRIVRYIPTFVKVLETYKRLLEAENKQLQQHSVMQAEVLASADGAAVGQRSVDTVAEAMAITNIKTGQLLNVEGNGFMFGTDKNTGEVKCFNISYLGKSSEEQP